MTMCHKECKKWADVDLRQIVSTKETGKAANHNLDHEWR